MIFDFDCTITNFHLSSNSNLEDVSSRPLEEFIEASLFKSFVQYLQKRGIKVGVASYGKKELILTLLNRVLEDSTFNQDNVVTPRDIALVKSVRWTDGCNPSKRLSLNKNDMLRLLAERLEVEEDQVCLLDDTEEHIQNARSSNYQAVLVPKCEKFTESLRALLKEFLSPVKIEAFIESLKSAQFDS